MTSYYNWNEIEVEIEIEIEMETEIKVEIEIKIKIEIEIGIETEIEIEIEIGRFFYICISNIQVFTLFHFFDFFILSKEFLKRRIIPLIFILLYNYFSNSI